MYGIDTSLVDLKGGTTGQILSKASNTDLDYTWIANDQGDITEVQAGVGISVASGTGPIPIITNSSTDLITTAGDILYGTAADTVARLGIGTAGQVLKVNSGATAPEWGTLASGGKLLQVVSATHSTAVTIASTTFTDTNLSATITPSATTSKILVLVQQSMFVERDTNQAGGALQLVRAATNILTTDAEHPYIAATGASYTSLIGYQTITYLDSPSTTSATTYKMQMRAASTANNGKAIAQRQSTPSSIVLLEIGA